MHRKFILPALLALALSAQVAAVTRPMIWVKDSEKPSILAKISAQPWANTLRADLEARVTGQINLTTYANTTNRDAFLRELPIIWTSTPGPQWTVITKAAGNESVVRGPTERKFNLGVDCSVLYYLTGDVRYARCAADILYNAIEAFINTPTGEDPLNGEDPFNGGWLFKDDLLKEARATGTQLPIMYDFLYNYLNGGNLVYSVKDGGLVTFNDANAQTVFRTFWQLVRDRSQRNSNWSSLMSTTVVNSILALNDDTERAAALQVYLVTGSPRYNSLQDDAAKYVEVGDIWPESLQYANDVALNDTYLMTLLERYDPTLTLYSAYPNLALSLSRISYLSYPNKEQISFGDGHRHSDGQPFQAYEIVYRHAKDRGLTSLANLYGALINGGIANGEYNRDQLANYESLGRHNEPLQLLWFNPTVTESAQSLVLPRTDRLPFAGIALQRNLSTNTNPFYGMMAFVGGAAHGHSHASGMSMELYGLGQVLGAKSGRTTYGTTINENYYRTFAANNTIIVNGASRGQGASMGFAINTVQVLAMEPLANAEGVSPDISFTTSSFLDDKGTRAEATQQRTLALIRTSPTTGYYVDIFRSDSSLATEYHDYIYRNVADTVGLSVSGTPLALTSQPNRFQTDIGDANQQPGWRYFQDTRVSTSTSASVKAQFVANSLPAGTTYMDLHLPGSADREYASVTSPPIVEAPAPYNNQRAPTLVVRQSGEAWNRPFAVVYEPHLGTATVTRVTKLEQDGVLVGLQVESTVAGQPIVQYVISQPNATDTYTNTAAGISFTGRFAVITDRGNNRITLYAGEGANLVYQNRSVASASGNNTQANVVFAPNAAPVITANAAVTVSNTAPTITTINSRTINQNSDTGPITFTIGDAEASPSSLTLSKTSSNPTLVPISGISLGGSGANRTVTVSPTINQHGSSVINIRVSDGTFITSEPFTLTVNPPTPVNGTILSESSDASIREDGTVVDQTLATTLLGAGGSSPYVDRCTVYVFQLPDFGPIANPFTAASFTFDYAAKQNTLLKNDLYGLGRRNSDAVLGTDYYGSTTTVDASDATLLQANILNNNNNLGLISTSTAGNTALINYLNAQYAFGAGAGEHVFLRLNTSEVKINIKRATLTMEEGGAATPTDTRPRLTYSAQSVNTP